MEKNTRLVSVDTLRGFDMFWIMGGSGIIISLSNALGNPEIMKTLSSQMHHVNWNGFAFFDMIFPLFLFIAGTSFVLSEQKRANNGNPYPKIIKRGISLVLLGIIYNGFFQFQFDNLRIFSVLGRIGLAWMLAAIIYLVFKTRAKIIIACVILLSYWGMLAFLIAPDAPQNVNGFSHAGNIVGYIDRTLFFNHLNEHHFFDPEGLLSTLPAIVTALLGMFSGDILTLTNKKVRNLLVFGFILLIIGWFWNSICPINKKLWSSSFVCFVGGISILLLTAFYWIIDVKKLQKWTFPFRIIGMNSLTIYFVIAIVNFQQISHFFFGGIVSILPKNWQSFGNSTFYFLTAWLFLFFLYRKKIFLKI